MNSSTLKRNYQTDISHIICFFTSSPQVICSLFLSEKLLYISIGGVHILYNADGVGGGLRFCYTLLYMVGGVVLTFVI